MNIFLLLTALLSALTGVGRAVDARVGAGVQASRMVATAEAIAPKTIGAVAQRPDGFVVPAALVLDLDFAGDVVRPVAPERRRE